LINLLRQSGLSVFSAFGCGVLLCFLCGCDPSSSTLREPQSLLDNLQPDTSGRLPMELLETRLAAWHDSGDTLPANGQKLLAVLADSIPGYLLEIASADTLQLPLSELVEARKVFYNPEGDFIELSIGDYVRDADFLRANWRRFNLADSVPVSGLTEDRRTMPGFLPASLPASCTWSAYNSLDRSAEVFVILDARYFVSVSLPLQDGMPDLSTVATWLDWDALKN